MEKNPLRILDSKNPQMQELLQQAPKLVDSLGEVSQQRFQALCQGLDRFNIEYVVNPNLVRGLDYYGHVVFEWVTDKLGSQSTVCGGGRYDVLVEQLGGQATPAVGVAMGAERLLLLLQTLEQRLDDVAPLTFFIIVSNDDAMHKALILAEQIRNDHPDWRVITNLMGGGFKSQFKKADKSGADFALIIGDDELLNHKISIKNLRKMEEQITIADKDLPDYLQRLV